MGVYKLVVVLGNAAYVSGHGPLKSDKSLITGRVAPTPIWPAVTRLPVRPDWRFWLRCVLISARSTASAAWSKLSAWSIARPTSRTIRP